MLKRSRTGSWMPAWVPESTTIVAVLLLLCSMSQTTTNGCDGTMLNGFNILPSYNNYFKLTNATKGLNTASIFIGGFFGLFWSGMIADRLGRRLAIFWGSLVTIVGIILQTAAQHIAMFVIARVVLGWGFAISGVASAVYLSETFPTRWRAWGVGLLNNTYYIGAFFAALVTLGSSHLESTWAWRTPSLFQASFSVFSIMLLPFLPESPRWLIAQGLYEEARIAVAQTNSNGNITDPVSTAVYKQIVDTIEWEKKQGRTMSIKEIFKTPTSRKRALIGGSVGPFSCIAGNIIASYYLGAELETAGITDSNSQLKAVSISPLANVVLNVWCFFCSLIGTQLSASWGRKPTALLSQGLLIICLFIIGGLAKLNADNPSGASQSLIYGNVAVMFLFQGFYSIAWTPLLYLYPPEVMNYAIRANGLALSTLGLNGLAVFLVFLMPIGIGNIGWKMYMINGGWDIITFIIIAVFWVETKGKSLEEIDALFGEKHSTINNVEEVRKGIEKVDVGQVDQQLQEEIETKNV
ncbi:general substrate transporter [Talaromyces proteolyticus]|uniref:General substrate transporter n=1 Tax=Talaromyces proteolyticus TaxID=1131652 RepID=A0AAD4PXB3_9EURO|nr:general substrate transporter [Talaromyces proteolyticus]KAH8696214.1 general substrate transporter [Talaromyces proteolyticus]